ncbi:MAG: WbuC family cupin fold metalloprotein [Solirubrobacterales bacterium]
MKVVTIADMADLSARAAGQPRKRLNLNLHPVPDDPVQRMLNALEPGTYVRPHRHEGRWELFVLLSGSCVVLTFADHGRVADRVVLSPATALVAEIPEGTWHTVLPLEPGTMIFESKTGPYRPAEVKDFAPWAPVEGEPGAAAFRQWLEQAQVGNRPPAA